MKPSSLNKYSSFESIELPNRTWPDNNISSAPIWCSVDLRDGNQALAIPMNISQKLELFELLVEIGFKEIEIGFPSASETEFNFVRKLVDDNLIPEEVKLQCLVQAREHLIKKTFEAIDGVPNAIVHIYNSTSPLQRKITFGGAKKSDIKKIAVETLGEVLISSVIFDVYQGDGMLDSQKSVGLGLTLQSQKATLNEQEINEFCLLYTSDAADE